MTDDLRTIKIDPPTNDDAERRVLTGVTFSPEEMPRVASKITSASVFWRQSHRYIWRALVAVSDAGGDINRTAVEDALDALGRDTSQMSGLGALLDEVFGGSVFPDELDAAATIVRRNAILRQTQRSLVDICHGISQRTHGPEEVSQAVTDISKRLATQDTDEDPAHPKVVSRKLLDRWERQLTGEETRGMDTGIIPIDRLLDTGWQPGFNYVLGAYSGHGKTTVMSAVAAALADRHDAIVDFHPYEIQQEYGAARVIAAHHGKRARTVLKEHRVLWPERVPNSVMEEYRAEMLDAIEWFKSSGIYIEEPGMIDVRFVEMRARALRAEFPDRPLVLCIDYMQKLYSGSWGESTQERISNASTRLIALAKEVEAVLIQATQFTGGNFTEPPVTMPDPQDARHTKDIRDDADVFLSYCRPWPYDGAKASRGILSKRKDRWGEPAAVAMDADGGLNTFEMAASPDWVREVPSVQAPIINQLR